MKQATSLAQKTRKGFVIVTVALGSFVICGFAGLALDATYIQMWKRKAQSAADAAATAAAIELKRTKSSQAAITAARTDAAANGFNYAVDSTVSVENPPLSGAHQGDVKFAQVYVSKPAPTYFMRVFGRNSVTVGAIASSGLSEHGSCVFVLDDTANQAMQVSGSPIVTMSCGVQVNSNAGNALSVTGGAQIATPGFNVVGGTSLSNNAVFSPMPVTGMPAEDDPMAWRPMPADTTACNHTNYKVSSSNGNGNNGNGNAIELNPGVYCGGIDINSNNKIVFNDGLYILNGGGLKIVSQGIVEGYNVTFFNTKMTNKAHDKISVTGGATLKLRAPRSGNYEGMLIFEDRRVTDPGPNVIAGSASSDIEGIIYMPNSNLNFTGGSNTSAAYQGIVVQTLGFTGNSTFKSDYSVLANGSPMVRSTLVQ